MAKLKVAKAPGPTRIYSVVGSDDAEVKRRARELAAELRPASGSEFGIDVVDAMADNTEQAVLSIHVAIEAIQTLPLFGNEKLVWIKDANFFSDNAIGRSARVQEALEELRTVLDRGLPDGFQLLLNASDLDKRRSFYKALSTFGRVEVFDKIDINRSGWEEDVQAIVYQLAQKLNVHFAPEALELFVRLAGADTRQLRNELEKLSLYLGEPGEVTVEVVQKLVAKSTTGIIWELGNNIAKRQLSKSLALVDQLLFQGETAVGILFAAIIPVVRNLLYAKELMESEKIRPPRAALQFNSILFKLDPDAVAHLPRKKDGGISAFALGIAACEVHRFTLAELRSGLEACLKANLEIVTTQLDSRLILEKLIIKLTAPAID
ncbi:MAG: DNA polymerase III subunit delta [Verrucomicrobia bacterium]|nr:DNA polymerase III subunit delta [Verrucomicrobiota bacterium]